MEGRSSPSSRHSIACVRLAIRSTRRCRSCCVGLDKRLSSTWPCASSTKTASGTKLWKWGLQSILEPKRWVKQTGSRLGIAQPEPSGLQPLIGSHGSHEDVAHPAQQVRSLRQQ